MEIFMQEQARATARFAWAFKKINPFWLENIYQIDFI